MSDSGTIRLNRLHHRLTAPAPNVLRLQVAARTDSYSDNSWSIIDRDLQSSGAESILAADSLGFRTRQILAQLTGNPPTLRLSAPEQVDILAILSLTAGNTGSSFEIQLHSDDLIYGLGQGTGALNRRDTKKEIWNIDVLGHSSGIHPNLRNLYQSIPFAILLRDGRATGIFWDYSARQHWDFTESRLHASGKAKTLDLYLFTGPTLPDILDRFTQMTGRPALPPRWALGYQQSRYSYRSREELEAIAGEFRSRRIPCDVLYLDIDSLDAYRVFTFGESFPHPKKMLRDLSAKGFKVSAIVDPGVKNDRAFPVLQRGKAKDAFVKKKGSRADFIGKVWPGPSRFPDFTNHNVRKWWGAEQARYQKSGLAGFWNDMNEPAIFDGPGKTLPEDCRHKTDFGPLPHSEVHNAYGMLMAQASYEGARKAKPRQRPFIVSRGATAGIQRHAAVWTGDNSSSWEQLAESIPMLLNLGLSGVPFCGADVGGFLDDCTGELLVRWTQLGAFTPFFRNHSNTGTRAQEPWAFGENHETICRGFIAFRYQLLPYIYSTFAETKRSGTPIMRPLAWYFANDPVAAKCSDQFLLGRDLLLAPVLSKDATARSVYLPRGIWFDFWSGEEIEGGVHIVQEVDLSSCPLYVRGGGIIPMAPPRQYIDPAIPDEEIDLEIWLGGRSRFTWYEDDGQSLDHLTDDYSAREIETADLDDFGFIRFAPATGNRISDVKVWRMTLHGIAEEFAFTVNGQPIDVDLDLEAGICSFLLESRPVELTIRWQ